MSIFVPCTPIISIRPSTGWFTDLKTFNLAWIRVQIFYYIFNTLSELLNRDLAAKIGRGIISHDLMDRECKCSLPSNINRKYVYEGK